LSALGYVFHASPYFLENQIDRAIVEFIPSFVGKAVSMAKRRGNPNWGKPEPIGPIVPTITEFEQVVREYKLTPDQYLRSTRLREWARRNKNSKYIPEPLLEAWGFEIESTL
jgi:predicted metal-binding protein